MFSWVQDKELYYLKISQFSDFGIKAYFTSRMGGVSTGSFNSLNLGLHTSDKQERVLNNRRIIAKSIGINPEDFIAAEQIHDNKVYLVNEKEKGFGALDYGDSISGIDALVTNTKDVPLISFYADCVPLYFLEPNKKVIALAHAGWKGTVKKIGKKTISFMVKQFGIKAEDIFVAIGPSISKDFYEVDDIVIKKFKREFTNYKDFVVNKGKNSYLLDLWQANINTFKEVGITDKHIILSNYCTYRDNEYFYSYRKEMGKTGRMASIIFF